MAAWQNSFNSIKQSSSVSAWRNADELINNNLSLNKKSADVSADGTQNIATSPMQERYTSKSHRNLLISKYPYNLRLSITFASLAVSLILQASIKPGQTLTNT